MTWCIQNPDEVDVIQDNLLYQLEPPAEGRGVPEWFAERATGFSAEQRAAVATYLRWYRDYATGRWGAVDPPGDIETALAYWTGGAGGGP
jgi:hypothetical protein